MTCSASDRGSGNRSRARRHCGWSGEAREQSRLDQQAQGAVNGRPAHMVAGIVEVANQLVSVEVLVGVEDMTDKHPAGARSASRPGSPGTRGISRPATRKPPRLSVDSRSISAPIPISHARTAIQPSSLRGRAQSIMILHSIRGHGSLPDDPIPNGISDAGSTGVSGITAPRAWIHGRAAGCPCERAKRRCRARRNETRRPTRRRGWTDRCAELRRWSSDWSPAGG